MLGAGYFNPLTGYMNKADALSVSREMKTTSGLFWPTPVLNLVPAAGNIKAGDRIALKDPNVEGNPVLAVMDVEAVEEFTDEEMATMSKEIYRAQELEAQLEEAYREDAEESEKLNLEWESTDAEVEE